MDKILGIIIGAGILIGLLASAAIWLDGNGYDRAMSEVKEAAAKQKIKESKQLSELTAAKAALEAERAKTGKFFEALNYQCLDVLLDSIDPGLAGVLDGADPK